MTDKDNLCNWTQNFVHLWIYVFENMIKSLTENFWLNQFVEVVDWKNIFDQGCIKPKNQILAWLMRI